MSYRIFSVGQAIKTLSSPQFSGFTEGRGMISILDAGWRYGLLGYHQSLFHSWKPNRGHVGPCARPGSLRSEAVVGRRRGGSRCSGRVGMGACITGDASARDAEGWGPARGLGPCARRRCWIANRSGSPAERFLWRVNRGPRHRRRQNRARGFSGSQCFGQCFDWGALRLLGAGQRGRPGFDRGSLQTGALVRAGVGADP